jgi:predicted metal-dependent peptidase
MAEISINDARILKRQHKTQRNRKYMRMTTDASGTKSVPELVLHPLVQRPPKDVIVREGDTLENNYQKVGEYKLADEPALRALLDKAKFNPDTFFYEL